MSQIQCLQFGIMIKLVLGLFLTAYLVDTKVFNNPIIDGDHPDPGAIKVDGVYYIVTTTSSTNPEKFPINRSPDLDNWERIGYIFNADNMPTWTNKDKNFWAPEIHKIGNNYHAYFTAGDVASNRLSIGVAIAQNVTGPYRSTEKPLLLDPQTDVFDATIINDNGNLNLLWKAYSSIWGRPLSADGLSFSSNVTTEIFYNELPWEDTVVEAPWYVQRGKYHYLFYSGHDFCTDLYRVGVARAVNPLGPYTKRGDPILASNLAFKGPGHNSMFKDLNDVDDIIVFHAFKEYEVCGPERVCFLASIGWGDDGWPYVYDF